MTTMNTTVTATPKIAKFKFEGFNPRDELRQKAHVVMDFLREKVPGDANLIAFAKKKFGKYYFKIEVNGSNAKFEANTVLDPLSEDTTDRNWLVKGLDQIQDSIKSQLKEWIKHRDI